MSQVPALIVSTAAGMVVTRSASGGELGVEITKQLLWNPKALYVVAAVLALFIVVPGFPAIPFFLAAAAMGGAAYYVAAQRRRSNQKSWRLRSKRRTEQSRRPVAAAVGGSGRARGRL